MRQELTINKLIELFNQQSSELDVIDLWFDWFCKDTSLINKGVSLIKKLKAISKSNKFDNEKTYVFFKNNCPCIGNLYDDFRICDIETQDVIYTVIPKSGFKKDNGEAQVWGKENNFREPIISGTWKEIKNWFLNGDNADAE